MSHWIRVPLESLSISDTKFFLIWPLVPQVRLAHSPFQPVFIWLCIYTRTYEYFPWASKHLTGRKHLSILASGVWQFASRPHTGPSGLQYRQIPSWPSFLDWGRTGGVLASMLLQNSQSFNYNSYLLIINEQTPYGYIWRITPIQAVSQQRHFDERILDPC